MTLAPALVLVNSAVAFSAAVVFARVGLAAFERRVKPGLPADAWLLLFLSAALLIDAVRLALPGAASGPLDMGWRAMAALAALPLAYVTCRALTRSRLLALSATGVLALATGAGLGLGYVRADEASALLALTTPALMMAGLLVFATHGRPQKEARRLRLLALGTSVWYVSAAMASLAAEPSSALVARSGAVLAAGLAYAAYFPGTQSMPRPVYWDAAETNAE